MNNYNTMEDTPIQRINWEYIWELEDVLKNSLDDTETTYFGHDIKRFKQKIAMLRRYLTKKDKQKS